MNAPASVTSEARSEFEKSRRVQETRNERLINYLQIAHFASVLFANVMTHVLPVAPYRASALFISVLAAALAWRVVLFFYLRREREYHPARKYVIAGVDIVFFTASPVLLGVQGAYPWVFIGPFAVCVYTILVVMSGLRYDRGVVLFTGIGSALIYASIFPWTMPPEYWLPMLMVGFVTLGATAACTAYSADSLIRMQRDASTKEQLARFLPPELVEHVDTEPALLQRRTERRNATVIFADIRGFTRMSETLEPERVVEFLNEFLDHMTHAIMDNRGMVDKYIGDAIMGVFGVPVATDDHAWRATQAALGMQQRLIALNEKLRAQGLQPLSIGIGLHTGPLLIGAIGSTRRLDYTVIGDTVNVASRIEGMTRSYPVEILVSDSTREAVGDRLKLYPIATVQVKNREQPLELWSPDPPAS